MLKRLNTLLYTIVLEALSREIKSICPEELLCAGELALVSEKFEGLKERLEACKGSIASKRLRVNFKVAKMIISSENDGKVTERDKFAWAVCRKDVDSN